MVSLNIQHSRTFIMNSKVAWFKNTHAGLRLEDQYEKLKTEWKECHEDWVIRDRFKDILVEAE